jgi:hypothetical protein
MILIALKGATRYELQIGRFGIDILRPSMICRRTLSRLITVHWYPKEEEEV